MINVVFCSVIHFLWVKGLFTQKAIHSEIRSVYGDKCFTTRPTIYVWCKKFVFGRESVVIKKELADVLF